MAWPSDSDIDTTKFDNDADKISESRAEIYKMAGYVNDIIDEGPGGGGSAQSLRSTTTISFQTDSTGIHETDCVAGTNTYIKLDQAHSGAQLRINMDALATGEYYFVIENVGAFDADLDFRFNGTTVFDASNPPAGTSRTYIMVHMLLGDPDSASQSRRAVFMRNLTVDSNTLVFDN